jgi:hypothetical protein
MAREYLVLHEKRVENSGKASSSRINFLLLTRQLLVGFGRLHYFIAGVPARDEICPVIHFSISLHHLTHLPAYFRTSFRFLSYGISQVNDFVLKRMTSVYHIFLDVLKVNLWFVTKKKCVAVQSEWSLHVRWKYMCTSPTGESRNYHWRSSARKRRNRWAEILYWPKAPRSERGIETTDLK